MIQLMAVPASLMFAVANGSASVTGALVKDAVTGQILAHLQPTRMLSEALSLAGAGPLAPAQLILDGVEGAQLMQIKQMLDTVQVVASIGAAASVLNLGVSIGGFALVLSALKKLDGKLDRIERKIDVLDGKVDAPYYAGIITALRRAEEGFNLSPADRRHRWLETEDRTDSIIDHTVERLRLAGVSLDASQAGAASDAAGQWRQLEAPGVMPMVGCLVNLVSARGEALLCLQRPADAARLAQRAATWLSALPTDAMAVAKARLTRGSAAPALLKQVTGEAKALTTWVTRGRDAANERVLLCQSLQDLDVDTEAYVMRVRDDTKPQVLMLPHSPAAMAMAQADTSTGA